MINVCNVTKKFDKFTAVENISTVIQDGSIYGLVGSNGAGKSTFMRMMCGVLKPDEGMINIDDQPVYENPEVKSKIFYISDEQYFKPNWTAKDVKTFYKMFYLDFDDERFNKLINVFGLGDGRSVKTYSKGMKKQLSIISAVCSGAKYLLCDETFDGLDPVARQSIKSLLANDVIERNITPIFASHNLRELEDICDHIGLMHRGGILFSKDISQMKLDLHKFQFILTEEKDISFLNPLSHTKIGSMSTVVLSGDKEELTYKLQALNPLFIESLPLTLEEIFITETEAQGYDIKKNIL